MRKLLSFASTAALAFCLALSPACGMEEQEGQKIVSCAYCKTVHLHRNISSDMAIFRGLLDMFVYPDVKLNCLMHHLPFVKTLGPASKFSNAEIAQLPHLTGLILWNDENITGGGLQNLTNLTKLSLSDTDGFDMTGYFNDEHMASLPHLEFFEINGIFPL